MNTRRLLTACLFFLATPAWARLGETEAQSQTRYGNPTPELTSPLDKPLLIGAKETIYKFSGYRIRVAFVNNVAVRLEYIRLPEDGKVKQLTEPEIKAIMEAEKGLFAWREEKPRTGNKNLNLFQTVLEGRKWERSDHATATLKMDTIFILETKDADALEKRLSKSAGASAGATPTIPKF